MKKKEPLKQSQIRDMFKPMLGLIVYEQKDSEHFKSEYYIEEFPVNDMGNGKYVAGACSPMRISVVEQVFKSIGQKQEDSTFFEGLMPKNILFFNKNTFRFNIVWYEKPAKRVVHIKNPSSGKRNKYTINTPITVFKVYNAELSVYVSTTTNFTLKTELYPMPLPNIYETNKVCLGDAEIEEERNFESVEQMMQEYSDAFWKSEFNDFHRTEMITTENIYEMLRIAEQEPFPVQNLIKTKLTLKDINESRSFRK